MDRVNLVDRPRVALSERNKGAADITSDELRKLGLDVFVLGSNNKVPNYLKEHPETAAVVMRNSTQIPSDGKGLKIAAQLIQIEGFTGPVIILTQFFNPEMWNLINEADRQNARIELVATDSDEIMFSYLYVALRAKYPEMTEGFGRRDLFGIFGVELAENGLIYNRDCNRIRNESKDLVSGIMEAGGTDECYRSILEKIEQWRKTKEGAQSRGKEKE